MVEGISRAGKIMTAVIVSAFEGVEPVQYAVNLETLLILHKLGKVSLEACRAVLHLEFDIRAFDMAVGRGLNLRPDDMSSVLRVPDHAAILSRAQEADRTELLRRWRAERRLPLHMCHEGLPHARALFELFPKMKLVSVLRDPASLMLSWHKRGYGKLSVPEDPGAMVVFIDTPAGPGKWWTADVDAGYRGLTEMDRCALSIAKLNDLSRAELEAAPGLAGRVCFLRYDALIADPRPGLARLAAFLGRKPKDGLEAVLTRERLPRPMPPDQRARDVAAVKSLLSPGQVPVLEKALADYDAYWAPLAR